MSYLFEVENNVAKPNTETLLISPFREIWGRDKSRDKTTAIKEFTFIEFMISKRKTNPYAQYDIDLRSEELKKVIFDDPNWEPDDLITQGMEYLHTLQTEGSAGYTYLLAAEEGLRKMKNFFLRFDLNERTKSGMPVYKPKEITTAMNDLNENLKTLNSLRERVEQDIYEITKTRTNRDINPFEV